jgi:hypothetical protein
VEFHTVVSRTREEARRNPPIESELLGAAEELHLSGLNPIILVCDSIHGPIDGFGDAHKVIFLNEHAWRGCQHFGLTDSGKVDESMLPEHYILLVGPASAASTERRFKA